MRPLKQSLLIHWKKAQEQNKALRKGSRSASIAQARAFTRWKMRVLRWKICGEKRRNTMLAEDDDEEGDENEKLGGLFRVKESKRKAGSLDCSKFPVESPQDWDLEEVLFFLSNDYKLSEEKDH
ncbi:ribosome biogenesis protein BMS1 homolog isoform X2 [Petaurus breviceps papuanus]|uniref:ribosome biogenesis protein BMS1 homolog isoform X2 n=1 Tax=Petaurus breviceps papuanus TaxID=3040969 RepID=UPI0036DF17B2